VICSKPVISPPRRIRDRTADAVNFSSKAIRYPVVSRTTWQNTNLSRILSFNFSSCCPKPSSTPRLYNFSGESSTGPVVEMVLKPLM
jgi:hypothetical protein